MAKPIGWNYFSLFGYSCTDSSFQVSYLLACTVRVHSLLSCWVTGAVLCLHFAHATNAIAMPITITNPIPTTQSPKLLVASDCSVVVVVVAVVVTSSMHCVSFVGPTQPPVHSAHLWHVPEVVLAYRSGSLQSWTHLPSNSKCTHFFSHWSGRHGRQSESSGPTHDPAHSRWQVALAKDKQKDVCISKWMT